MKIMDKISIIIPVYNSYKYLEKCLESIVNQNYPNTEIILVDDGSSDNSSKIYNKYLDKIKVIKQEHKGTSCARNKGIENSNGKYICFVDSDDFVEVDYVKFLYELIKKYQADIGVCAFDYVYSNYQKCNVIKMDKTYCLNNYESLIKMCDFNDSFDTSCCNKIYKASLFEKIRFPENMVHEDIFLNTLIFEKVDKVVYQSTVKYHYFVDKESTSKAPFTDKEYDRIKFCDYLVDTLNKYNINSVIVDGFYLANMVDICNKLIDINKKNTAFFKKTTLFARKKCIRLLFSNYMFSRKINLLMLSINYKIYIVYYKMKRKLWKRK